MENQIKLVRCPVCGSADLQALADTSAKGNFFTMGWIGLLIRYFKNRNKTSAWWECQSCGHTFPIEK